MTGVSSGETFGGRTADSVIDTWGYADIEAAIDGIDAWIEALNWKGPRANRRLLISGHSNGGEIQALNT